MTEPKNHDWDQKESVANDGGELGFVVTLRDVYDIVVATHDQVQPLSGRIADAEKHISDHERRIRGLERETAKLSSAWRLVMGAGGALAVAGLGALVDIFVR